jgi:hypothetical protein
MPAPLLVPGPPAYREASGPSVPVFDVVRPPLGADSGALKHIAVPFDGMCPPFIPNTIDTLYVGA